MMAKDEGKKGGFQMPNLKSLLGPKESAPDEASKKKKKAAPAAEATEAPRTSRLSRPKAPGAAAAAVSAAGERGVSLFKRDFEDKLQGGPTYTAAPMAGEPGYKSEAYQRVKASSLGISTFSDDKNYVGNVGGLSAVRLAAEAAEEKMAADKAAKKAKKAGIEEPPASSLPSYLGGGSAAGSSLLPDYLQPLPEDTPTEGKSWKNY